ncbi:MAG: cyclic nucleotide-binding domain-containing protein [Anaerolineales bacterium]|nr:cyclic nucleotide-binding domain-containing protein [Anaerolineales bacterium]
MAGLLGSVRRQKNVQIDYFRAEKPNDEKGLNPLDLLSLPPLQRDVVNYLSRKKQASLDDIQERLKRSPEEITAVAKDLEDLGYIYEVLIDGVLHYRVYFGGKVSRSGRGVPTDIWDAVDLDNTAFLKQLSLFSHLADNQLQEVANKMTPRRYKRNQVIIWQGDIGDHIYFIKNGIVGISRLTPESQHDEGEILAYLKQGDVLAEHNLLEHHYAASGTATALSEVDVLLVRRQELLDLLLGYDQIALELAKLLSERLMGINTRLSSKGADIKLSLIFGVAGCGTTTIGSALALTLADLTKRKAVYTEHPNPSQLPEQFAFEHGNEIYSHPAGYDIAMIEGAIGLPATVRTTLVMDRLLNDYANIIVGLKDQVDESITYMLEKANQVVIVTPPDAESWRAATRLLAKLRTSIHPERTSILLVVNRKSPELEDVPIAGTVDLEIPYISTMTPLPDQTLETLPDAVKVIVNRIADRLGRTNQIGIYIPTTTDVDQVVDTSGFIQETITFLGEIFGGASASTNEAHGVWNSDEVGLVSETIHIVRTYVTQAELDRYLGDVLEYVEGLKDALKQEAMALEVNQKLMII